MKTRRQKVFAILVACFLCASFFAVPVFAVDQLTTVVVENEMYEYGSDESDPDQRPYIPLYMFTRDISATLPLSSIDSITAFNSNLETPSQVVDYGESMEFTFQDVPDYPNHFLIYYINQLFDDNVERTFAKGDTLFIDASFFEFYLFDIEFSQYRFTLRDAGDPYNFYFGPVVASTDIIDLDVSPDDGLSYDRMAFNFSQDIAASQLCLCIEFNCDISGDEFAIEFYQTKFSVQFGAGVSPDYPVYPSAPGGDNVNDLDSAEQELMLDQQQGLTETESQFSNFSNRIFSFGRFFGVSSNIMAKLTGGIPYLDTVVFLSLTLGIYASLLGLAGAIVSAADRKAGREARQAERDSRKK